jgi:release factor glutamine methyltransferase
LIIIGSICKLITGLKKILKYLTGKVYKPLLSKYLSKTRIYTYKGIRLIIPPSVFHPRFFFSTKILLKYISQLDLQKKSFLELGAGSGLISIYAAKKNANVTATDINPVAIEYLKRNQVRNNVTLNIISSDLFQSIPPQLFDVIAINPPYYKKNPKSDAEYAWYCGENGEYFQKLFCGLKQYIHSQSLVLMILSEDCDILMITKFALDNHFDLQIVSERKTAWEKNNIYQIIPELFVIEKSLERAKKQP